MSSLISSLPALGIAGQGTALRPSRAGRAFQVTCGPRSSGHTMGSGAASGVTPAAVPASHRKQRSASGQWLSMLPARGSPPTSGNRSIRSRPAHGLGLQRACHAAYAPAGPR